MSYKAVNRFFVFTLALLTALAFFGVKPSDFHSVKSSISSTESKVSISPETMHNAAALPPVGIETKDEQPTEDDETTDAYALIRRNQDKINLCFDYQAPLNHEIITSSRSNFRYPLYIRIHSIVI